MKITRTRSSKTKTVTKLPLGRSTSAAPCRVLAESTAKVMQRHVITMQLTERQAKNQPKDFGWILGIGIVTKRAAIRKFQLQRHWGWLIHPVRAIKFDSVASWRRLSTALIMAALSSLVAVGSQYWSVKTAQVNLALAAVGQTVAQIPDGSAEASDESSVTTAQLAEYKVPADQPRVIEIPSINVKARVRPMGLNADKSIQAPTNVNDAGWYSNSAKPGVVTDTNKATFIDGHDVGRIGRGVFYRLNELNASDEIIIERGDGVRLNYKVEKVEVVALDDIDMNKVLTSAIAGKSGLNLMTCDGAVITKDGKVTQSHRLVVYAELI